MPIARVDHVVILVTNIEAAETAMARLGFAITPRGIHSGFMGTENSTFVFQAPNYVEIVGIAHQTPDNERLRRGIDEGYGLFGIALNTVDAAAAAEEYAAAGFSDGRGARDFSRPVNLPEGARKAEFRTAYFSPEATQGLFVFVCEHRTPELVWRSEYTAQENGVTGLKRVLGTASDLDAAAAMWRRIAPARTSFRGGTVTTTLGPTEVCFMAPKEFAAIGPLPPTDPGLGALVFASADMARTREVLGELATETETGLRVAPESAAGVTFLFEPE